MNPHTVCGENPYTVLWGMYDKYNIQISRLDKRQLIVFHALRGPARHDLNLTYTPLPEKQPRTGGSGRTLMLAKSVSDAARQLVDETGRKPETIRNRIIEGAKLHKDVQLSTIAGTDKHIPIVALGEKEILEKATPAATGCLKVNLSTVDTLNQANCSKMPSYQKRQYIDFTIYRSQ